MMIIISKCCTKVFFPHICHHPLQPPPPFLQPSFTKIMRSSGFQPVCFVSTVLFHSTSIRINFQLYSLCPPRSDTEDLLKSISFIVLCRRSLSVSIRLCILFNSPVLACISCIHLSISHALQVLISIPL